jgi:PKD repeat protein
MPAMIIALLMGCSLTFAGCTWSRDTERVRPYFFLCDPATGHGPIDVSIIASRLSGVAPLSVFFDATGTTGLANRCFFADNAAYMDATFAWNFDAATIDPGGNYATASGFVAAHVFEKPGSYTVRLNVTDADGDTATRDMSIEVLEFSGTTYYVAANGSDGNDGLSTGAPFLTPRHALSSSVLGPNVRVLFRNGDTFTISSMVGVSDVTGPIIIGAYSDPAHPSSINPIIYTTAVNTDWATIRFYDCTDVRIMDIAVRATAEGSENPRYPFGISWNYGCSHMLKYRTEEYHNGGMAMSPAGRYSTVAECDFHNTTQTGYTSSGEGVNDGNAIIGNRVYDKNVLTTEDTEHIFRLQGGSRYFIAHNTFGPNNLVHYDALTIRGNSEKVVVYNNRMEGWV